MTEWSKALVSGTSLRAERKSKEKTGRVKRREMTRDEERSDEKRGFKRGKESSGLEWREGL